MSVYSFIHHIHCNTFRQVLVAIIGQWYSYIDGKNWGFGLSCTTTIHAPQLQHTLCNSVIIPNNVIIKIVPAISLPPLPLGHVTSWWGRGKFNLPFSELWSLKASWISRRNVYCHQLETPHMTRVFLLLLRQRSAYTLVCFLRSVKRECQCAGYIYIYIYTHYKCLGTWLD